jgi:CHAD domain-containing protein
MAKRPHNPVRAAFAARVLHKPLHAMQHEIAGVRRNEDLECVHHMRVASRRLRNAFDLFQAELPAGARERWRKRLRNVTKCLGAARDLDVHIEFLRQFLAGLGEQAAGKKVGIEHVRDTLAARRGAVQEEVLAALHRLESSRLLSVLRRWVVSRLARNDPEGTDLECLRAEAADAVRERLSGLFAYEPFVEQPDAVKELHAMRIAAKHLRYTLEAYAPLYPDGLATRIQWLRQLQDWLGEIHDCDVWHVELGRLLGELAQRSSRPRRGQPAAVRLTPGINYLRRERAERRAVVYAEFVAAWRQAAASGYWEDFRGIFDADRPTIRAAAQDERASCAVGGVAAPSGDERLRPVLDLAQACHYETEHTHHVTRLALRLFARLARLHGLDDEGRFWLTCAALLHDIGWCEGRGGHHKTALRLTLESPRLPWDERLRRVVGSIARYHRKALPSDAHEHFAVLAAADRAAVRTLAAILRVADALDYSHAGVVDDVACRVTAQRISIRCTVARPADIECQRAVEKGDLMTEVFARELRVTWQPR